MIEIIVAVCLIAEPSRCKDVKLDFDNDSISVRECTLTGQTVIARWNGDNPGWQVTRWSCTVAGMAPRA
jgi:hypothetical protein